MDVTWNDPPPPFDRSTYSRASKYADLALELAKQPGRWALLGDFSGYSSLTVPRRRLGPGVELRTSQVELEDGRIIVRAWARSLT